MRLSALLLVAALAPVLAQAPMDADVILAPGHPDLMTADITLADVTDGLRVVTPSERELGTITTSYAQPQDGQVQVTVAVDAPQAGGSYETVVAFAWPSMAPISRELMRENMVSKTTYDGARVMGESGRGEWDPLPYDITLQRPAFAPEQLPLVIRALPLREGYNATVPTFTAENRVRDYTVTVIGEESFTRADGTEVMAWAVERTSSARGDSPRRYFVDGDTRDIVATTYAAMGTSQIISEPVTEASLAAMAAAPPAVALRPNVDRLATDAIRSYSQDYVVKLVQPQQQDIGTVTRTVTVDEAAGTVTSVARTEIAMAGQMTTETAVASYPTLAPISSRVESGSTVVELMYDGMAVTGSRTSDGETTDIDFTMTESFYDPVMAAEIVRLIPMEEGFRGAYHTIDPREGGPMTIDYVVRGQEEVAGRTAWIVDVVIAAGAPPQAFAVDAETREVLRIRLEPQVGVVVDIVPADAE